MARPIIWVPDGTDKETEKKPDPIRFLLTVCSGDSDRMLPPSVRSILERSKTPGITTECVRSQLTRRSQSLVEPIFIVFAGLDAGSPSDRTQNRRVRSLLLSKFTSYELTGRWTLESGAASGHSFSAILQSSIVLPVPTQVPTSIRPK